jgi:beta-lactamase regulating signal transducer with metallopeptidase domain
MTTAYFSPIADHLWQSTAFAVVAGLLTLTLRRNRARVRHGLWLAASCKFLVPLSLLIALGGRIPWRAPQPAPPGIVVVLDAVSEPFTAPAAAPWKPAPRESNAIPAVLLALWACGFVGISISWAQRWRRIAATVRAGTPAPLHLPIGAVTSSSLLEPGVFGIFRPVLVLPAGIFHHLTPTQLQAVIAHELCHVRHRDNLVATLQMFVETLFWFHPMVWWIGKRMVEERERACDEGVLRGGSEPRVYAEAILNVCKLYAESPLVCVSGVTGANLKRRIEGIMTKRIVGNLHIGQKVALVAAGAATFTAPIMVGMLHTPMAMAQSKAAIPAAVAAPPAVAMIPRAVAPAQAAPAPQPAPAAAPQESAAASADYSHFTNRSMASTFVLFGPPDQIEFHDVDTDRPTQIWRYRYLERFHSNVEFEFMTKSKFGMRLNYPPAQSFEGTSVGDASAAALLARVMAREAKGQRDQAVPPPTAGLPGRHSSIQIALQVSPTEWLVNLTVPMDRLSGRVDLIGQVVEMLPTGEKGPTAGNFRDYTDAASTPWQSALTLRPGSYVCRLLVREQASGQMYTEEIPFELK